jgi:hypothetical protein
MSANKEISSSGDRVSSHATNCRSKEGEESVALLQMTLHAVHSVTNSYGSTVSLIEWNGRS